jgi:hypothetical protein
VIDGNRIIFRWLNRLPNLDGRTEPYQFAGITVLEYAGDGSSRTRKTCTT